MINHAHSHARPAQPAMDPSADPEQNLEEEQNEPLVDVPVLGTGRELSEAARQLIDQGRTRFKSLSVFEFVPCNYEVLWDILDSLPRGRFCELGSGWGIATGLAEILGFEAQGVEIAPELVAASRQLLADNHLRANVAQGDYLQRQDHADVYFTYAWPSHMRLIDQHFLDLAQPNGRLLYCTGQNDIRCKMLASR